MHTQEKLATVKEKFAKKYEGRRVLDFSQVSNGLINLLNDKLR